MWLCLNDSFLSIVEPSRTARGTSETLLVRARRKGDIERVFPGQKVVSLDRRDYQFRAEIDRHEVARAIAANVLSIDYGNFKDSVKNRPLHDAYAGIWHVMAKLQPQRPYSDYSKPPRQQRFADHHDDDFAIPKRQESL